MKSFTKKSLVVSLLAGIVGLASSSAMAGSVTANFQATASIAATCVVSATNVAFGSFTPAASGNAAATGTITSTCTKSTPYTLAINAGSSASIPARTMGGAATGNTDKLAYNLYTDSGHTTLFGDGTTGNGTKASLTGTGAAQTTTVYGNLALNQYITPDNYADTLTVTLAY